MAAGSKMATSIKEYRDPFRIGQDRASSGLAELPWQVAALSFLKPKEVISSCHTLSFQYPGLTSIHPVSRVPGNHLWPHFFMPLEGTLKPFSELYQAYKSSHKVQSHHGMFLEPESRVHMPLGVILHFLRRLLFTSLEA